MPKPILVVEDDPNIAALVEKYLTRESFAVTLAADGETALAEARRIRPALVILDLMLPRVDGWEVCRRLRAVSDVPILMLTARAEEVDRIVGLTIGADDYVVKPFSPAELVARVKAILRRASPVVATERAIVIGDLTLMPEQHRLLRDSGDVTLTPSEFRLLATLMGAPGRVFTRDELLERLHTDGSVVIDRVVDVHVGRLRQKIETDPAHPDYLLTVRGTGYRFVTPENVGNAR
ncbi:MAG: response regulator transcription factor [Nitrospirota bacterium]|nr:response regulator transcription factor [Nitrospirota bacterium]